METTLHYSSVGEMSYDSRVKFIGEKVKELLDDEVIKSNNSNDKWDGELNYVVWGNDK